MIDLIRMQQAKTISRRSLLVAGAAALAAPSTRAFGQEKAALIAPDVLRADFTSLYETLRGTHFDLYARTPRARYDELFKQTYAGLKTPMTRLAAERLLQRFVAAGHVAHARIDYLLPAFRAFRAAGGRSLALEVRIVDGRLFVLEDYSGDDAMPPGAEIAAFEGLPAASLLDRLWSHVSADTAYMAQSLIELDFAALVWTEFGARDAFTLTLRKAGGPGRTVVARTKTRDEAAAVQRTSRLSIDPTERLARLIDGVAYLRPGVFINLDQGADPYDTAAFKAFIDKSFGEFRAAGARALLIDLRDNPGGHNAFSDHMVAWFATRPFRFYSRFAVRASAQAVSANRARLAPGQPGREVAQMLADAYARAKAPGDIVELDAAPAQPRDGERFAGPVHVLVNRRAYSNSVATAALIQDYGFGRILGEATSDLATTFGAMEQFTLPRTGVVVGYPKAFIVRPNGDLAARGVMPDTAIAAPIVEGVDDPVLRQALTVI